MKFENILQRIDYYAKIKGLNDNRITTDAGLSVGLLGKSRKNKGGLNSDSIDKILHAYIDLSAEWLLTGNGKMLRGENLLGDQENKLKAMKSDDDSVILIPLVSIGAVAGFGNPEFAIQKNDVKDYYVVPKFKDRRIDFMIEIAGSSMYPKYSSGDVVACTILRESKFIQWNKVHVIGTAEQGILIKRIKKGMDDDHLLLISDNKDYDPFTIRTEEITGMAIVIGVIRLE